LRIPRRDVVGQRHLVNLRASRDDCRHD
jgi:hypothetical protein